MDQDGHANFQRGFSNVFFGQNNAKTFESNLNSFAKSSSQLWKPKRIKRLGECKSYQISVNRLTFTTTEGKKIQQLLSYSFSDTQWKLDAIYQIVRFKSKNDVTVDILVEETEISWPVVTIVHDSRKPTQKCRAADMVTHQTDILYHL